MNVPSDRVWEVFKPNQKCINSIDPNSTEEARWKSRGEASANIAKLLVEDPSDHSGTSEGAPPSPTSLNPLIPKGLSLWFLTDSSSY